MTTELDPDILAARKRYLEAEHALDALYDQKALEQDAAQQGIELAYAPKLAAAQEAFDEAEEALWQIDGDDE